MLQALDTYASAVGYVERIEHFGPFSQPEIVKNVSDVCLHVADLTPRLVEDRLDQDNRLHGVKDKQTDWQIIDLYTSHHKYPFGIQI